MSRRKRAAKVAFPEEEPAIPTFAACTQCLRNADLLDTIFLHFAAEKRKHTLCALAQTSRDFSPSAIKLIWRELSSIYPLLKLIPGASESQDEGYWNFPGLISDESWAKFDSYASLVRSFRCAISSQSDTVDAMVYARLAMRRLPLFPNLRDLSFLTYDGPPGALMLLSLAPSVASLRLESRPTMSTQAFLDLLTHAAQPPQLAHLVYARQSASWLANCSAFRELLTLEVIHLHDMLSTESLAGMGQLPKLTQLTVELSGWDTVDCGSVSMPDLFPSLVSLIITDSDCKNLHKAATFLPLISSTKLESIKISRQSSYRSRNGAQSSFAPITRFISDRWAISLRKLELSDKNDLRGQTLDDGEVALVGLTTLETLSLANILPDVLSHAATLAAVCSWSSLQTLTIINANADMAFLQCIAEHCPTLKTLHVAFLVTPGMISGDHASIPVCVHHLEVLSFRDDDGYGNDWRHRNINIHVLARQLDRLFPFLKSLKGSGYGNAWSEVEKLVLMCQDVRKTAWEQK